MSLVEIMLALSLGATLLVAVGASVNAAVQSHRANSEYAAITSRTRIAMLLMTNLLRNASHVAPREGSPNEEAFSLGGMVDPETGLRLGYVDDAGFRAIELDPYDPDNTDPYWGEVRWREEDHVLEMRVKGTDWQVLAQNVTAFNVRLRPRQSEEALRSEGLNQRFDTVEEITISMTISPNSNTTGDVTMVSSVVPRRAVWNGEKLPLRISTMLSY